MTQPTDYEALVAERLPCVGRSCGTKFSDAAFLCQHCRLRPAIVALLREVVEAERERGAVAMLPVLCNWERECDQLRASLETERVESNALLKACADKLEQLLQAQK